MLALRGALLRTSCTLARPSPASRIRVCTSATMMLSPPELAAQRAGLTLEEAFSIDQPDAQGRSLYARLGDAPFQRLANEFYDRVYADEEQWFRDVFAHSPKAVAIRNNYEFMIQRCGGPTTYSQRRGHPALPRRHAPFDCSQRVAERYMLHMDAALAAVPELSADDRRRLHNYFLHTCHFLSVAQEMRQHMQQQAAAQGSGGGGATAPAARPSSS